MKMKGLFSFLLTSLCVRFAVGMLPVWVRWKICNRRRSNGFGSDYPLDCNWFLCWFLNTGGIQCADLAEKRNGARRVGRFEVGCWAGILLPVQ